MPSGRVWTTKEINKLYFFAEKISQKEAARRLERSLSSVQSKAKALNIRWRQGSSSLTKIAKEFNCSFSTVKRLLNVLFPYEKFKVYGSGNGTRFLLNDEQVDKIKSVLSRNRKTRKAHIEAGRKRVAK
jgi:transposase